MNIIMSRAVQHHHPFRGLPPMPRSQQQVLLSSESNLSTPNSPTSPLDFTDRIPINEIRKSPETLGSGSFGTVFKGRWRGRDVAIKEFKTREEINSFLVEVKQLSCVKHKNIVTLYGASISKDTAYLIMEYAEGGSLNHLLHECKEQDYDLRHACSWAMQTARGVAYLHSIRPKPIMHRDLKPANLLLFSRGSILKICDFGTACATRTQMTNNTGSASYMAPEVFATSSYMESCDVFSWGIIFWEILVRSQPYQSTNPYGILWNVAQGARPDEIVDCPELIWRLITRSWDENPEKRPSMAEVAQDMELILSLTKKQSSDGDTTPRQGNTRCKGIVHRIEQASSGTSAISPIEQNYPTPGHSRPLPQNHCSQSDLPSNNIMTTSDHVCEMRQHHQSTSVASTFSTNSSHQYRLHRNQNQSLSELQYNERFALERRVEALQARFRQLEEALECDKKNTASISFEEFHELKVRIRTLRRCIKERSEHHSSVGTNKLSLGATSPSPPENYRVTPDKPRAQRPSELHLQ